METVQQQKCICGEVFSYYSNFFTNVIELAQLTLYLEFNTYVADIVETIQNS